MDSDLKLYLWEEVLTDYTDGVIFVLAHTLKEALELIEDMEGKDSTVLSEAKRNPYRIITEPEAFYLYGGG